MQQTQLEVHDLPAIALTEMRVSAKCCHLLEKDDDSRECGNVITATAFDSLTILFKAVIKASISQS